MAEHPLYLNRHDQQWYDTDEMSDFLTLVQAEKPHTAFAYSWQPDPETGGAEGEGSDYKGNAYDSVDGKSVYVLPVSSVSTSESAAVTSAKILAHWKKTNPNAKPKSILMTLLIGGDHLTSANDHFTTLCVCPDPENSERADIVYINPLGDLSDGKTRGKYTPAKIAVYARQDQEVIEAVKEMFPDAGTTITVNNKDLQEDSKSCGPLALDHLIALGDAENPAELVRSGDLAGQQQVTALREEQGMRMQHIPEKLYLLPAFYGILNNEESPEEGFRRLYYFGQELRHLGQGSPVVWNGLKIYAETGFINGFTQSLIKTNEACDEGFRRLDDRKPLTEQDIKKINKTLFLEDRIAEDQIAALIADQETLRSRLKKKLEDVRKYGFKEEDFPKLIETIVAVTSAGADPAYARTYDDLPATVRTTLEKNIFGKNPNDFFNNLFGQSATQEIQVIEFGIEQPETGMDIESAHIAGPRSDAIVAAARQQKPDEDGRSEKDRLVEDNALAIVFGNAYDHSAMPGLLAEAFAQLRNSGEYLGHNIGCTASVAGLTMSGVDLRSAGDSIIAAVGSDGRVSVLNTLHTGGGQVITNFVAPGRDTSKRDYIHFISWEDIEASVGPDPTIIAMTDGISKSHDPDQVADDIQSLLVEVKNRWNIGPQDPEFPSRLIEVSKTMDGYRGYKEDDTTVVTGQKPKDASWQSVIGVFDGMGKGHSESAIVAKEMAETLRDQFVSGREHAVIPVAAAAVRKETKSALTQIHDLGDSSDYTAAQEIILDTFTRIFKTELPRKVKGTVIINTISTYTEALPQEQQITFLQKLNDIAGGGELPAPQPGTPPYLIIEDDAYTIAQTFVTYTGRETLLDLDGKERSPEIATLLAQHLKDATDATVQNHIINPVGTILIPSKPTADTKLEILKNALHEAVEGLPADEQTGKIHSIIELALHAGGKTPDTIEIPDDLTESHAAEILATIVAEKAGIHFERPTPADPPDHTPPITSYGPSHSSPSQGDDTGKWTKVIAGVAAGGALVAGGAAAAQKTDREDKNNHRNLKKGLIAGSIALGAIAAGALVKLLVQQRSNSR